MLVDDADDLAGLFKAPFDQQRITQARAIPVVLFSLQFFFVEVRFVGDGNRKVQVQLLKLLHIQVV